MEPLSLFFHSHRLKLHYWDYGSDDKPPLVLVHGGLDHARSWDAVAAALRDDYHVYALDLRGHGDSQWAPGALYTVAEHVLDMAALCDVISIRPLVLIGHSLGGVIVLQYAGTYPEAVHKVVAIEGLGPPPSHHTQHEAYPDRLRRWIDGVREAERRTAVRTYPNIEAAVARMREANPHLSEKLARHLTSYGMNRNPDGSLVWKFDPFVRGWPPYGFDVQQAEEILNRITCPGLLFHGGESWASDPEKDGCAQLLKNCQFINVPRAGHWLHHDQPDVFLEATKAFLVNNTGSFLHLVKN